MLENDEVSIWETILTKLKVDLGKIGYKKKFTLEEQELLTQLIGEENG